MAAVPQARSLLRLGRYVEVSEKGLGFIEGMYAMLAGHEAGGALRRHFKEAGSKFKLRTFAVSYC